MVNIKVIIPTYNAGAPFESLLKALQIQIGVDKTNVLFIDSSSTDNTVNLIHEYGFEVLVIDKKDFGHGRTRKMVADMFLDAEILVYMTQDALPADRNSIVNLVSFLKADALMGAAYGRQLPYPDTDAFGIFARLYNYPEQSHIYEFADKKNHGIKTAFLSDSFAAYKRKALNDVGGFPDVTFGEDTCVAAKMLMQGLKIGYNAKAQVYHSHSFSLQEEFVRCKIIGSFHKEQPWLLQTFGKAEGEGIRFVKAEIIYLASHQKFYLIPFAFLRNVIKFLGYKLGSI